MRICKPLLTFLFVTCISTPMLAAEPQPVPPRDCNGDAHGVPDPHKQANYDGQADKECHGVTGQSGNCTVASTTDNVVVTCTAITYSRVSCTATRTCADGSKVTCGGRGHSAFGGVNAQGKAYALCINESTGATHAESGHCP